jgi:hypothetical protein
MESTKISSYRLGRRLKTPHVQGRTLRLADYIDTATLPPPPAKSIWGDLCKEPWGMMGNDVLGDCTCAAVGHGIQIITGTASVGAAEVSPTTSAIEKMYQASGWIPGHQNTDNGWLIGDALDYWRNTGVTGPNGSTHKIAGWVSLDQTNFTELCVGAYVFGGVNFGLQLPLSAQYQNYWAVVPQAGPNGDPGSWGGHSVWSGGYDQNLTFRVITWGAWMRMSKRFTEQYVDEAYCVVSPDWIEKSGVSPTGIALPDLLSDLAALPKDQPRFA